MTETVEFIGDLLSLVALLATLAFVVLYATRSPWREGLVSRALMYVMASLSLVLVFVFIRRWLDFPPLVLETIGTGIYAILVGMLVWLVVALLYGQAGRITADNPNYTPIRDWIARHRVRRRARSEK